MHTQFRTSVIALTILAAACGDSRKDKSGSVGEIKTKLETLRKEKEKIEQEIDATEKLLAALDPSAKKEEKAKLVAVSVAEPGSFDHYIDLQGRIDANDISYVTPRGAPGQVRELLVKKGDYVKKGQLLLKLDDALIRQQIEVLKTQLRFAEDLYKRQQNLWKQDIGTEVQLLTAKNNVESLERQIAAQNEQLATTNVYAQVSGVADEVNIRVGETFTGDPMRGIKIVNTANLKAVTNVPENYLSRVKKGTPVKIVVPDLNKEFTSTISLVSQEIGTDTRSFAIEARVPNDPLLKPNLIALVKIQDYSAKNVISVPLNTVQPDEKGKYVLVAVDENGKLIARKRRVETGEVYGEVVEIKSGIAAGDKIITDGFQNLYDGQLVTTTVQ